MQPFNVNASTRRSSTASTTSAAQTNQIRDPQPQSASATLKEQIYTCLQGAAAMFASCLPCLSPEMPLDPTETSPLMRSSTPPPPEIETITTAPSAIVTAPKPLNERCLQATSGWNNADASFSWHNVDTADMQAAKTTILQNGITPMLQELLGDDFQNAALQQRLTTCAASSPQSYSAEEFGLRIYFASNDLSGTGNDSLAISSTIDEVRSAVLSHFVATNTEAKSLNSIAHSTNADGLIRVLFKIANKAGGPPSALETLVKDRFGSANVDLAQNTPLSSTACAAITSQLSPATMQEIQSEADRALHQLLSQTLSADFSSVQGKAFGETVAINQGSAEASVGLHLLTHELMHTLADPTTVATLRQTAHMGDEGPNEFFARLASSTMNLDQSTSTEQTPYTLNAAWSDQDRTRTLAKAYFLGDPVALQQAVAMGIPGQ